MKRAVTGSRKKLEEIGIQVTKYSVKPAPVLVGRFGNDPEKKTVLIYAHYDVKPAGERKLWHSDPFVPTVRDGKFMQEEVLIINHL